MRVDLHVHSRFSKRPSQWFLQKIGCPESFTDPLHLYQIAKQRGMSLVTITDHNTIDGALEIAHLPDTFISEEITSNFPEDGCKVHVLALNINEKQHADIQRVRENLYELAAYLQQAQILHVVAHPLYGINDRLTAEHFEKMLLLFKHFELNGARDENQNHLLRQLCADLGPDAIEHLSAKHDLEPLHDQPWQKYLLAGSDDHSSLNIARAFTEIPDAEDIASAMRNIRRGQARVVSVPATPQNMAHNLYGIAYQFYKTKFQLRRYVNKDLLIRFLDRSLTLDHDTTDSGLMSKLYFFWRHKRQSRPKTAISESLIGLLRSETQSLLHTDAELMQIVQSRPPGPQELEQKWYYFVNRVSNKVMRHFADHLLDHLSGANVFNIFQTIGSAGGVYTLLAPYFVAFAHFTKDRVICAELQDRFNLKGLAGDRQRPTRVAHFTDTFYEVNGVALTLQQQVQTALRNRKDLAIITCDPGISLKQPGIENFKPIGVYELAEYPEQKIFYPPLLEMLNYCFEHNTTLIHSATPGLVGLTALAIARILKLPISATYHTAIPQYARLLTGDDGIEELTWKYTIWYYDQMDYIYVPSRSTGQELISKGISADKIRNYPRGIDIERFNPAKRNGIFEQKYGLRQGCKLLYVGRVSKEKNLDLLLQAFRQLGAGQPDIQLVVVGDGPYLNQMKQEAHDLPCLFTGYLEGAELEAAYASSDLFVFPSTTDTFGNVVLEAQASGLPVIVTDQGGPHENMLPGLTGLVVPGGDGQALGQAIQSLTGQPQQIAAMGRQARQYIESRSFDHAFLETWCMYREEEPMRAANAGRHC